MLNVSKYPFKPIVSHAQSSCDLLNQISKHFGHSKNTWQVCSASIHSHASWLFPRRLWQSRNLQTGTLSFEFDQGSSQLLDFFFRWSPHGTEDTFVRVPSVHHDKLRRACGCWCRRRLADPGWSWNRLDTPAHPRCSSTSLEMLPKLPSCPGLSPLNFGSRLSNSFVQEFGVVTIKSALDKASKGVPPVFIHGVSLEKILVGFPDSLFALLVGATVRSSLKALGSTYHGELSLSIPVSKRVSDLVLFF